MSIGSAGGSALPISADRPADPAGGFTLLEVVIALAIAGLALIALFRAGSEGILAVDVSAQYEEALQRAESHLAQLTGAADLSPGGAGGDDGNGYRWQTQIRPLAAQPAKGVGDGALALLDIEVTISWGGRGRQRSVALHTRRLGTASVRE